MRRRRFLYAKGTSKAVLSLKKISEQGRIMGLVQEAYNRGIIRQASYTNAVKYTSTAIEKLQKSQASALTTQTKLDMAQTNFIKHSVNLMRYRENFSVLKDLANPAIEFESAIADVRKVVDFETPKQFKEMGQDIINLSLKIPMAAEGLAQIVADGGQSGIAR